MLMLGISPDGKADTLIIQKTDTLIYLIPLKDLQKQANTSNPIATFVESRDKKNMINKLLKNLIIHNNNSGDEKKYDITQSDRLRQFDNMLIGNIIIKRLPPFGPSVNDTISSPLTWLGKTGNRLRVPTGRNIISNSLTFKSGDRFNSSIMPENERIIRNLDWINDARIEVKKSLQHPGMIDIMVIVQDKYPHAISIDADAESPEISLYTSNFMGQGVYFNQTLAPRSENPKPGFEENIRLNNIAGSRIDLEINYINNDNRELIEVDIERNFYVTSHKYGGGAYYNRSIKNSPSQSLNQFNWPEQMDYYFSSTWMGRRFTPKTRDFLKNSHFYLTIQHIGSNFYNLPDTLKEHPLLSENNSLYASISFGKRDYFKNSLVYSYGKVEDIPFGFIASLTGGVNHNSYATRPYLGFRYAMGHTLIPNLGYIYMSAGWESYFNNNKAEQATISGSIKYITPLIRIRKSHIRTFLEAKYINGINRYPEEELYINQKNEGVALFSNHKIKGTQKLVLNLENVAFLPGTIWGFKIAQFSFADIAFINSQKRELFSESNMYGCIGAGIKIRNERLVFKTIELRAGYIMGKSYNTPVEFQLSNETQKKFDEFIPSSPKFNLFK